MSSRGKKKRLRRVRGIDECVTLSDVEWQEVMDAVENTAPMRVPGLAVAGAANLEIGYSERFDTIEDIDGAANRPHPFFAFVQKETGFNGFVTGYEWNGTATWDGDE